ncbi:MAG: hypothetical protein KF829_09050 [Ferruginibacter sp.]|nr:hypothetical protein [Ferruginibacter sp.]
MKILFPFLAGAVFCFLSITASAQDQGPLKCVWHIEKINFHKPKRDCKSGFGLCIRSHWHIPLQVSLGEAWCIPWIWVTPYEPKPAIEKDEVVAGVIVLKDKVVVALPKEIAELKDYAKEDFSVLEITEKIHVTTEDDFNGTILPQKVKLKVHDNYLVYELLLTM